MTYHMCICDDIISDAITSQDDVTLQLAKMMTHIELSMFKGESLMHLHKNVKNSVKSPI